jgi:hypothetical protein
VKRLSAIVARLLNLGAFFGAGILGWAMPAKGDAFDAVMAFLGSVILVGCLWLGYLLAKRSGEPVPSALVFGGGCFLYFFIAAILHPVFASARMASAITVCGHNLKELHTGVMIYTSDNDDRLPLAPSWQTAISGSVKEFPRCPKAEAPVTYGFNELASGLKLGSAAPDMVLLFEMDSDRPNAHGGAANLVANRHGMSRYISLDGRLLSVKNPAPRWSPTESGGQ